MIRERTLVNPGGPRFFGGVAAFRHGAQALRENAEDLAPMMTNFSLPMGARRCLDGAHFLQEGGLHEAAELNLQKAVHFGQCQQLAVDGNWPQVADTMDKLSELEEKLVSLY